MTFIVVNRGPRIKPKMEKVARNGIALKWWANPTAPFLGINIGDHIARSIGMTYASERVDFLFGEGENSGRCGIRRAERGGWVCRVRGGEYCVFLDSDVSREYFALFPRLEIQNAEITVYDESVFFTIPKLAQRNSGATA